MKAIMFPGQGSQYKGMGKDLFKLYPEKVELASNILGYDLEELCLKDPKRELSKTQFTQPALYVVNVLRNLQLEGDRPDFFIGHSLGEYNALQAAGAFDFVTGLRLVEKRGALMAAASGGGMAAVLGMEVQLLEQKLKESGYDSIDIANYNTPDQIVIAGPKEEITKVVKDFDSQGIKIIPLHVSAPFHSRYMKPVVEDFSTFLKGFEFSPLHTPVIANTTARPYEPGQTQALLSQQIDSSVQWIDSIRYLMGRKVETFEEVGGMMLTKMVKKIEAKCEPIVVKEKAPEVAATSASEVYHRLPTQSINSYEDNDRFQVLGNPDFCKDYGIKYAYLTGAMYRGIASKEMVVRLGKARLLGFLGTGGLGLDTIEQTIIEIKRELNNGEAYGMNLLHSLGKPEFEMETVKLYLKHGIKNVEAAAYMQMNKQLVYYRLKGLERGANGQVICGNRIVAKVSRPEVAEVFMRPAPTKIVNKLLSEGLITEEMAELSKWVPMSHDLCIEADSGGHTDGGVAIVLLPSIQRLRETIQKEFQYQKTIRLGLAGGIGSPQAAAAAYIMGADFILTGSINQCTVEAGTSDTVKDLLQDIDVQDTAYAPAGDMFEIGAKVQVLRKGVLFAARSNKLYTLYSQYNGLDEIPEKIIGQLERNYFKKNIAEVWKETEEYFISQGNLAIIEKARKNPRDKMSLVFRWYFGYSGRLAFAGDMKEKVNFQVHTGPALGAFNQWVKGTELENWRNRHVDIIAEKIMEGTLELLDRQLNISRRQRAVSLAV